MPVAIRGWLVALAWSTALCLPAPSWAEADQNSYGIVSLPGGAETSPRASRTASELEGVLRGLRPVGPEEARDRLAPSPDGQRQARRAAKLARRELDAFDDLERAGQLLERAAESYLDMLPALDSADLPLRLFVDLATVGLALGEEDRVEAALARAVQLDPGLDLDPREAPSRLVEAARRARESRSDAALLSEERARRWAAAVDVDRLIVVQALVGSPDTLVELYSRDGGERLERWELDHDELGEVAEALVEPEGDGPEGPAPDLAPRPRRFGGGPVSDDDGPRRFGEPAQGVDGAGDDRGPLPWYRKWWVWTLVGAAVAAGAATGVVVGLYVVPPGDLPLEVSGHW